MAKEFFHYPETAPLFTLLEETSHRSGVSRAQAFEDWLTMSVCCLSGGRMEEQYLQTVAKHTAGKPGKRGCDSIAKMFGELVAAMEQDSRDGMKDILGDLFEGAISYGEHQQYLTPMPLCSLMARLTVETQTDLSDSAQSANDTEAPPTAEPPLTSAVPTLNESGARRSVFDPACGSGRMLLAVAQINRHWDFCGQDVDGRCAKMAALNLAFRNLYGYVIQGNSLALERKLVYRTGFDGRGFIREIPLAACPAPVQQQVAETASDTPRESDGPAPDDEPPAPKQQLRLF